MLEIFLTQKHTIFTFTFIGIFLSVPLKNCYHTIFGQILNSLYLSQLVGIVFVFPTMKLQLKGIQHFNSRAVVIRHPLDPNPWETCQK